MKLTSKGRYAVMAMVDLARNCNSGPVTLAEISERQDISLSYLEQLFRKLRKGSQVKSVRGPGGGYLLSRDPGLIRIFDIILAVDEPIQATRCVSGSPEGCQSDKSRCLTHDLWFELGNHIQLFLSSISLEDVVNNRLLGVGGKLQMDYLGTRRELRSTGYSSDPSRLSERTTDTGIER